MRVLHLNLVAGGIGRYGSLYTSSMFDHPGLDATAIVNRRMLGSEVFGGWLEADGVVPLRIESSADIAAAASRVLRVARRCAPDVVIDTAGAVSNVGPLVWPFLGRRCPVVIVVHDPEPHSGMGRSWIKRVTRSQALRRGTRLVVHGPAGKAMLIRQGVGPGRIWVVRHGHLGIFAAKLGHRPERDENRILFFGELRPNKGLELLTQVAQIVTRSHPKARFVVAGSPKLSRELARSPWRSQLSEILDQMERSPVFEVRAEFVPDEDVAGYFLGSGITIIPYLNATQSGVAMLAMPLGSVVLATQVGDLPDIVRHEETGFLAEPNPEKLARELSRMLDSPETVQRVRRQAQEFAIRQCSWNSLCGTLIERCREITR